MKDRCLNGLQYYMVITTALRIDRTTYKTKASTRYSIYELIDGCMHMHAVLT